MLVAACKQCSRCKVSKPLTMFYKHNSSKDGYRWQCIACHHTYQNDPNRRKRHSQTYYKKRKLDNPQLFMWKQAKHRAAFDYKDMEFSIAVDDIQLPETCPYFGRKFEPLDNRWGYSLDRIDSSKGYIKGNIQVISKLANVMKNNATVEELQAFAEGVMRVHPKEGTPPCS